VPLDLFWDPAFRIEAVSSKKIPPKPDNFCFEQGMAGKII
jgi:hypothetical protein